MDRNYLIKQIQFILFDEYDESPSVLNTRYHSGYYNKYTDEQLIKYYEKLKHPNESKNLQYQ